MHRIQSPLLVSYRFSISFRTSLIKEAMRQITELSDWKMCVNEWTRVECRRREKKRDNEMKVNWPSRRKCQSVNKGACY